MVSNQQFRISPRVSDHNITQLARSTGVASQQNLTQIHQLAVDIPNMKNSRPFGSKWINHIDPDIYDSDLNTDDDGGHGTNQLDKYGGLRMFAKSPAAMDRSSIEKQDMDLRERDLNPDHANHHSVLSKRHAAVADLVAETYLDQTDLVYKPSLDEKMKEVQKKIQMAGGKARAYNTRIFSGRIRV